MAKYTKAEYEKATAFLKKHIPFTDFAYDEHRKGVYRKGANGSGADFVEIGVETLIDIALDIQNKS